MCPTLRIVVGPSAKQATAPMLERLQQDLASRPATLNGSSLYITNRVNALFQRAMDDADRRGDQYVGTEHLLMAAIADPTDPASKLFASLGLDAARLSAAFDAVRGGRTVDDPGAETRFQALDKYGVDLTELAANGKLPSKVGARIRSCWSRRSRPAGGTY